MDPDKPIPLQKDALRLYESFQLNAHPESGWYKETHRSKSKVIRIDDIEGTEHSAVTSIYFLLDYNCRPRWRRLKSDEIFVWIKGSPLKVYLLKENVETIVLGDPLIHDSAERRVDGFQVALPRGSIFNAEIVEPNSFSLFSCFVAPGFEWGEFSMISREELLAEFPQHQQFFDRFH